MSGKFKKFFHQAREAAARAAKRAARTATKLVAYWTARARLLQLSSRWRALPLKMTLLALLLVAVVLIGAHHDTSVTAGGSFIAVQAMLGLGNPGKFLYRTSEAKAAIGCGTTRLYSLIDSGVLEARRYGHRTYITGASLEAFVASLPRVVTPTMAKVGARPMGGAQSATGHTGRRCRARQMVGAR